MRVLDCGCGPGSVTIGLAEAVAPGDAFGIDIEPRQVEAARALAAQRSARNVQFKTGSIYELPFPDASFDAVYAQALLVHLSAPVAALKEMRRVLKPGGFAGVVDGDLGCMLIGPASAAIEKLVALQARAIAFHGGDPFYARNLRPLMHDGGFRPTEANATIYSFGSGDSAGRSAADMLKARFQGPIENTVLEQHWATRSEIDAMVAELEAWSQRPDTFMMFVLCWALGWVPA
jgi:SAM-dependent methyltransferase